MPWDRADRDLTRHSYYAATAPREARHPPLQGETQVDVAVVGGGLAGLSAAIELAERGFSVALLEARQLGWGASGRNGGQVIAGLACEPSTIEAQLGFADARRVWDMTLEAIDLIHRRRESFGIACDWQAGFLSLAVNARKARALRAGQEHMAQVYGYTTDWIASTELPRWIASPRFHSGVHDPRSGHLHPLRYCLGLARAAAGLGVRLYEDTPVQRLVPGRVVTLQTPQGRVLADHVLLAGNVYLRGLVPELARRIMPVGTYLVATERLPQERIDALIPSRSAACTTDFVLDYFRPTPDGRVVFGGGVSYSTVTPRRMAARLRRRLVDSFPQLRDAGVAYAWGGFVDISMNRAPDFGRVPLDGAGPQGGAHNIYYLQGFSGHGLALTGLAGKLVAEAISGDATRFDVFARLRHRSFPGGAWLRTPALVLAMSYYRLRDLL
ncbi:FAD-binding oxidoreductase [Aquabacterium sp. A7-Y]|uniref:NAD(P)/FAD-dependent oxidoreductase n=1 Tax=Aquabacterium sp. A7-Y TaxID=1349605 RepID=UPI00223DF114|nr:FAD-binding oxidoreductase [Aquabacterium sp. A7-Y]MCW7536844.1 FAD-binding oxidoreductase [Aquabacterium sp. A7-Y]